MTNKSIEEDHAWKKPPTIMKFQDSNIRRSASNRRYSTSRYQNIFFGICYCFNHFGNKVVNCRAYVRGINIWNRNGYENFRNHDEKTRKEFDIIYNKFGATNYEIECYSFFMSFLGFVPGAPVIY